MAVFLISVGEQANCFACVRDLKGAAMYEFCRQAKANTASSACRKIPSGILPEGKSWWAVTQVNYANDGHFLGTLYLPNLPPRRKVKFYK